MIQGSQHLRMRLAQALRIDHDADVHRKAARLRIEIQIDRYDLADFHPQELYRCVYL